MKLKTLIRTIVLPLGPVVPGVGARFAGLRHAMRKQIGLCSLLVAVAFATGCTLPSTSTRWNGLVGPHGKPVYVKSHTNIGLNLAIFVPFLGSTTLSKQIDELTQEIADENGDVVRMIESAKENYWYGFPPFTWIVTPVITTVTADYQPDPTLLTNNLIKEEMEKAGKQKK